MFDLNSLAALAETLSGVGAAGAALWKFFIAPGRKHRTTVLKRLNDIDARVKSLENDMEKFRESLQAEIDVTDKDLQRDIDDVKKSQQDLRQTLKDHIEKVDAKNDKLLDLIIKYFTDKD